MPARANPQTFRQTDAEFHGPLGAEAQRSYVKGTDMDRLLYTVSEAGHLLSLQKTKMYELMGSGQLASVKIDGARRIPRQAIQDFIDRHATADPGDATVM